MKTNRRDFLKASAANLSAAGLTVSSISVLGAPAIIGAQKAKKYRTALIGSGWWGMNILREAMASGQSKVVALCDADARALNSAAEKTMEISGDQPKQYRDFRELLEKEKPEIVIIATPDHWHALITVAAVKSGAHVF